MFLWNDDRLLVHFITIVYLQVLWEEIILVDSEPAIVRTTKWLEFGWKVMQLWILNWVTSKTVSFFGFACAVQLLWIDMNYLPVECSILTNHPLKHPKFFVPELCCCQSRLLKLNHLIWSLATGPGVRKSSEIVLSSSAKSRYGFKVTNGTKMSLLNEYFVRTYQVITSSSPSFCQSSPKFVLVSFSEILCSVNW